MKIKIQAVRHLPLSSQLEYKKLLDRMKILEQRKLDRLTTKITQTTDNISVTVQNDLSEAEREEINNVPENSLDSISHECLKPTSQIDSITVKVELSSNTAKRSVITGKPASVNAKKRILGTPRKDKILEIKKMKIVPPAQISESEVEFKKMIESLDGKNDDEKLEILKNFESNYASCRLVFLYLFFSGENYFKKTMNATRKGSALNIYLYFQVILLSLNWML